MKRTYIAPETEVCVILYQQSMLTTSKDDERDVAEIDDDVNEEGFKINYATGEAEMIES